MACTTGRTLPETGMFWPNSRGLRRAISASVNSKTLLAFGFLSSFLAELARTATREPTIRARVSNAKVVLTQRRRGEGKVRSAGDRCRVKNGMAVGARGAGEGGSFGVWGAEGQ